MLQLRPVLLQVRYHRQDVDYKEAGDGANEPEDTTDLGVEDGDEGGDQEDHDVHPVEYLVYDLLVSEEKLEAQGPKEVINQREAAEKQHEQGETHDEGERV